LPDGWKDSGAVMITTVDALAMGAT
jgi:hypothetical protein